MIDKFIMEKLLGFLPFLFIYIYGFGQTHTSLILKQKGILFLSSYNYMYDEWSGETKPVGFHDYFFPTENFDKDCLFDSNKSINFNGGLRVGFFKSRIHLKNKALLYNCKNINNCYQYDKFYVVPVMIDYKIFEDNWPLACKSEFFDLEVIKGSKLRFYHLRKKITIVKIKPKLLIKTVP